MIEKIELKNNYIDNENKVIKDLDMLDYKQDFPYNIRECAYCNNIYYQIDMVETVDGWICENCLKKYNNIINK